MTAGSPAVGAATGVEVVRPGDPGYETARQGWNRLYPRYPAAIVYCRDTTDVVDAVDWARTEGLAFRARSGGHHLEGWSAVDGGVVIDVSRIKHVRIDPASGTATVGSGLNQAEAVARLGQHGWAIPTGSEGGVGLGGVVLGGGFGLLTRKLGLACDRMIGARIVVVDGGASTAIDVSVDDHRELLWACRGGGGNNFGIVTSYTMELTPLAPVAFGYLKWKGHQQLADLVRAWQGQAPVADERLSSALEIGSDGAALTAVWYGGGRADLEQALAPLSSIGAPDISVVEDDWPAIYAEVDKAPRDVDNWKFYSQFVKRPFTDEAVDTVCRFMAAPPSPASNYYLSSFGGAVRVEPAGGSAFAHRDALFYAEPGAGWNGRDSSGAALGWVADFARAMRPHVDGAYVNVPNVGVAGWEQDYYGDRCDRLRNVKARYDPGDVFRFEQSIPVAAPSAGVPAFAGR